MWNARLDELQAGSKIAGRNINNLRSTNDTTVSFLAEREEKEPLAESEGGEWKASLNSILDFPGGPGVKNLLANAGDTGSNPGPGSPCDTTTEPAL